MTRSVVSCLCLVSALIVVGCTKSPTSPPKAPTPKDSGPKESATADTTASQPEIVPAAPADEKPPAKDEVQPATDSTPADTAAAGATTEPAKPDMDATPPADVVPPAPKLPFEDIVAALGNEQATAAYRRIEQMLAQNPDKAAEGRLNLAWFLNTVGGRLSQAGNQEKAYEAFRVATEQLQSAMAEIKEPLPPQALQQLSTVFYNGACAQSIGGKPEDAKAMLQKAVEMGFSDLELLRTDADLAAVRALPDFEQQLTAWQSLITETLAKQAALQAEEAQKELAKGTTFPFDFALTDLSGQNVSLTGYQGKVLIVDFWATWCGYCVREIPSFIKLQNEYGPTGLQIVGLAYEDGDDEAAKKELVTKFIQEKGVNYTCALGTTQIKDQVPEITGFPTTVFIDRAGKVRAKVVGEHSYAYLEAIVKALLAEAAPAAAPPAEAQPAAPTDTPPAAPAATPPAGEGTPPADTPPAEPGK